VDRSSAPPAAPPVPPATEPWAIDVSRTRQLSPTDIAQFIRLEQCERYLRLRLVQRATGRNFLLDYGVTPQPLPMLLTRSGADFEAQMEQAISQHYTTVDFGAGRRAGQRWADDHARLLAELRSLPPGQVRVLFQPRLAVTVAGWRLHGDIDLLRLERAPDGHLHALIVDMKSSKRTRVEHRLQVAFYQRMLAAFLADAGLPCATIAIGILYRGTDPDMDAATEARLRDQAERMFGTRAALLELVDDADAYLAYVEDLVTGPASTAARIAALPFDATTFHLTRKCDGCLYGEFCLKWAAERDDLSLVPHLTAQEKTALRQAGVTTATALAHLKQPAAPGSTELAPAPGQEALVRRLAVTWPVGPHLDELVYRARAIARPGGRREVATTFIPGKGYSSLPDCRPDLHPNLVLVFLDAQHDYLTDRLYLVGARVVAHRDGAPDPQGRRTIVRLSDGPPATAKHEADLLVGWIADTLRAIVELAAPDAAGRRRAPIHLVFYDAYARTVLLDALGRHLDRVLGATPLYDFLTQLAAFDSPVATILEHEIRRLRAYPLLCQSLQAVASYLGFDWGEDRHTFRARLFDWARRLDPNDAASPWYAARPRFSNQLPLEYAYTAWGELPAGDNERGAYRLATPARLRRFAERRLAALEHVTRTFRGNPLTQHTAYDLPDLAAFTDMAPSLAGALAEFVTIERHIELAEWKAARLAPPEARVLAGQTLLVRYVEADQTPDVRARNRENERRWRLQEQFRAAYRAAHPTAGRVVLPKEQRAASDWSQEGLRLRLRLVVDGVGCSIEEALALTTLRDGARLVICPRWEVDSRLPAAEQVPYTPTAKAMLYGLRGTLVSTTVERDAAGVATGALLEVELWNARGKDGGRGFVFPTLAARQAPLQPDGLYTLDEDPNNWTGYWNALVTDGLLAGQPNTLYERLVRPDAATVTWPPAAQAGQARLLAGLEALAAAGLLHDFEPGKRAYIGEHGDAPILLVQGPPGTGKSYTTAFALFARLQGAMAAGRPYRVLVCCKTHAATDVLLDQIATVQQLLRQLATAHADRLGAAFDPRLFAVPLFRIQPHTPAPDGVIPLAGDEADGDGRPAADRVAAERWCIVAATPGGVYRMLKDRWPDTLFGHVLFDGLVLDEASQMNLPEACLAALPLAPDGHLIVVGDHRQMPPIVRHAWEEERRRTFAAFRAYESLFTVLAGLAPPTVRFAESFRLHADMAELLRREIYYQDGIPYHSRRRDGLPAHACADDFVAAVLAPEHPIVVIVHDEAGSQLQNPFEQALIRPVLEQLTDAGSYRLEPVHGLGVVVPHRAQRAALQTGLPALTVRDADGTVATSAVDTVERFQGDERTVIVVSATESDRDYLVAASKFLLDPRRLTVALSRAKQKLIVVAARSIFSLFAADEETFARAQLWKNLLRRTCTVLLWRGEREGHQVEVWGNVPSATPGQDGADRAGAGDG
jgi:hypothetical protein